MFSASVRRVVITSRSSRSFATTSIAARDFVQELYVKELKAYRPVPAAKDAHLASTKQFSAQSIPTAPHVPSAAELATELAAYDAEVAAAPLEAHTSASHGHAEEAAEGADEYLKLVEADVAHSEKH